MEKDAKEEKRRRNAFFSFSQNRKKCLGQDLETAIPDGGLIEFSMKTILDIFRNSFYLVFTKYVNRYKADIVHIQNVPFKMA